MLTFTKSEVQIAEHSLFFMDYTGKNKVPVLQFYYS